MEKTRIVHPVLRKFIAYLDKYYHSTKNSLIGYRELLNLSGEKQAGNSLRGNLLSILTYPGENSKKRYRSFVNFLYSSGLSPDFTGYTVNGINDPHKETIVSIILHNKRVRTIPDKFRVLAIMTAYNEGDIIEQSILKLIRQGVNVYVIDNWSNDSTYKIIKQMQNQGLIVGSERFPPNGPLAYFELSKLLERVEDLSKELKADWIFHHDVDEVRYSPWAGLTLREACWRVGMLGFNAIDHTIIEFRPIDNGFKPGMDFEEYFRYFQFGQKPGHFLQIKAWKNEKQHINLVDSGGHQVLFDGRKVCPFKFLLKHYPVRGQKHGEKKIFKERQTRWSPQERARGWHKQYDRLNPGYSFLHAPAGLRYFNQMEDFNQEFLIERLSGIFV